MAGEFEQQGGLYTTWKPLRLGTFEESSMGHQVFPIALEGRRRPPTTLNAPLTLLFQKGGTRASYLDARGIHTVGQLLQSDRTLLQELDRKAQKEIPIIARQYLEGLAITPHGRLIADIFAVPIEEPIDNTREASLVEAAHAGLQKQQAIDARTLTILDQRYGLTQGYALTQKEIADNMHVGHTRVGQLEQRALRNLQKDAAIVSLKEHLMVPLHSIGREVYGAIQYKDLPPMGDIWKQIPPSAQSFLTGFGIFDAEELLRVDLSQVLDTRNRPLPEEIIRQIKDSLRR